MLRDLLVIFVAARLAGELCARLRQPGVVGELLAGIIIGPALLDLVHPTQFTSLFAELGVVFLLFIVGLETNPTELWRVGRRAAAVGVLGVVLPFGLGYAIMMALGHNISERLFVGAALTATSVGITARVLADLNLLQTTVARVILGAAVFDDILGILVLAVISGMTASTARVSLWQIGLLAAEAIAFCVLAVTLGRPAVHRLAPRFSRRADDAGQQRVFALAIAICLAFSFLASYVRLAAIVGAFLAGILFAETQEAPQLRRSMAPISALFVPIFFVIVGAHVTLEGLGSPELVAGALITVGAIVGKLAGCGLAAVPLGRRNALAVGVGMIPRGEVGLVVASLGLSRGVISGPVYAEVIFMCMITSIMAPPLLRPVLAPRALPSQEEGPAGEGRP